MGVEYIILITTSDYATNAVCCIFIYEIAPHIPLKICKDYNIGIFVLHLPFFNQNLFS